MAIDEAMVARLRVMHDNARLLAQSPDPLLRSQFAEMAGQIEAILVIAEADEPPV